jgi:hypothetical protein
MGGNPPESVQVLLRQQRVPRDPRGEAHGGVLELRWPHAGFSQDQASFPDSAALAFDDAISLNRALRSTACVHFDMHSDSRKQI